MEYCLFGERRIGMNFLASEKGQGMVEYALIFVLVILVAFVLLPLFAPWLTAAYNSVINNL
jgi:Flp pilus assembly pilin Flp